MVKKYFAVLLLPLALLVFSLSSSTGNAADAVADPSKGFIGAITCKDCHEKQYETYRQSVHSQKHVKGPESQDACETCHGAGAAHVEKGGGRGVDTFAFEKEAGHTAEEITEVCFKCHASTPRMTYWDMGNHKKSDVACTTCHVLHGPPRPPNQLAVCFNCHRDIKSAVDKLSRHPVKEGKVKCSDCHDVHGSMYKAMAKAETVNMMCYTCHADKRGPFVWQHAPVEENCMACHNAHGSSRESLLVSRVPVLCNDCHSGVGTDHRMLVVTPDMTNARVTGQRSCLKCHNNIHGSANFSGSYLRN